MKSIYLYFLGIVLLMSACHELFREKPVILRHKKVWAIAYSSEDKTAALKQHYLPAADTSYLEYVFKGYELVGLQDLDSSIKVDLKYADTNNFLKTNFYDGLRHAYFPCEVATRLCNAQYCLKQINPGLSLVILDAARPLHLQQLMWDSLKMPPDKKFNYLSPPYETSLHNYGCAVDLTIMDISQNMLIDMGSDFDTFDKISQPVYEQKFIMSGMLSQQAFQNRRLLRYVMKRAGFNSIASEWWHFGYGSKDQAAAKFKLIK